MSFARWFPITVWMWRQLTSRPARIVYKVVFSILLVGAVAFRLEAALFQRRVTRTVQQLSSFQVAKTTRAQAFSDIPDLKPETSPLPHVPVRCGGDECLVSKIASSQLLSRMSLGSESLFTLLQWWGMREGNFEGYVVIKSGTVSEYGYHLMISEPRSWYPGAIFVGVSSRENLTARDVGPLYEESPDYRVRHYFKWPDLDTEIDFTARANRDFVGHAFSLHLSCLWSLGGCRHANELLPEAEQDRKAIEAAAIRRLYSDKQCPNRIVAQYAREMDNVVLVRVRKVGQECASEYPPTRVRLINLELERVVKGKVDQRLVQVPVQRDVYVSLGTSVDLVRNASYESLHPGQNLLIFSDEKRVIDSPCAMVVATDSALQTVEQAVSGRR